MLLSATFLTQRSFLARCCRRTVFGPCEARKHSFFPVAETRGPWWPSKRSATVSCRCSEPVSVRQATLWSLERSRALARIQKNSRASPASHYKVRLTAIAPSSVFRRALWQECSVRRLSPSGRGATTHRAEVRPDAMPREMVEVAKRACSKSSEEPTRRAHLLTQSRRERNWAMLHTRPRMVVTLTYGAPTLSKIQDCHAAAVLRGSGPRK
jgi:hypothetical protein